MRWPGSRDRRRDPGCARRALRREGSESPGAPPLFRGPQTQKPARRAASVHSGASWARFARSRGYSENIKAYEDMLRAENSDQHQASENVRV